MFGSFQKLFKGFAEIEVRCGITGGEYAASKIKINNLKKKDLPGVLSIMHEITERPQIPARTQQSIPIGNRKLPVETNFVSV